MCSVSLYRTVSQSPLGLTLKRMPEHRSKSPAIVKLGQDSFYAVWDLAARDALAYLHPMLTITTATEDSREGIAAFAERRAPRWTGR